MHPIGSLRSEYDYDFHFAFFLLSDLPCLRSSRPDYNASTINCLLVCVFSLHFDLKLITLSLGKWLWCAVLQNISWTMCFVKIQLTSLCLQQSFPCISGMFHHMFHSSCHSVTRGRDRLHNDSSFLCFHTFCTMPENNINNNTSRHKG